MISIFFNHTQKNCAIGGVPVLNGGNRNTSGQLSQQANSKTASKVAQRHCILPKYNLPQKFTE